MSKPRGASLSLACGNQDPPCIKSCALFWALGRWVFNDLPCTDEQREGGSSVLRIAQEEGRNANYRERIPSDPRAVDSQSIVGPSREASPPSGNILLQKEQLELFGPRGLRTHIPFLSLFSERQGPGFTLGSEGRSQARGPCTQRRVFCPWPLQKEGLAKQSPT